jgi:hypothetical protein
MKDNWNGTCICGHLHSEHGPSGSINYTAGRCTIKGCECRHFLHKESHEQPYLNKQEPDGPLQDIPEEIRNLASELARIFDPSDRHGSIRASFRAGAIGMYRHNISVLEKQNAAILKHIERRQQLEEGLWDCV